MGTNYAQPHVFILSKGKNAGKPLNGECPNCFVCLLKSENEVDSVYWMCFALWQSGTFRRSLVGSVIPFLRKNHVQEALINLNDVKVQNPAEFDQIIYKLKLIAQQEKNYQVITQKIQSLKQAILYQIC